MIYIIDGYSGYFRNLKEIEEFRAETALYTAGTEDEISDDEIHAVEPYYPAEG